MLEKDWAAFFGHEGTSLIFPGAATDVACVLTNAMKRLSFV